MEGRKRPLFIIIAIAAKVTGRPFRSCKCEVTKGRTCREGWAEPCGDPVLINEVFHAMHVILSLKLGDHEGLALFVHGWLPKRTLLLVLPAILIQILICEFLSPVLVYC